MAWKTSCKLAKGQQYWLIMTQQIVIDIPASLATMLPASQTIATDVAAFAMGCAALLAFFLVCFLCAGIYNGLQALLGLGARGLHSIARAVHR